MTSEYEAPEGIGPYRIIQVLGEGGMGAVYEAEQQHPIRRRVAVKIVRQELDSREVASRFETERQALAIMDHPSIARVFDAGTMENGRPYFVMELVSGQPITGYCETHRLTLRDQLQLFIPVCRAVQHAHQKGIIHRDIKPSNILVTEIDGRAVPKVIDFGIAKATARAQGTDTAVTTFGAAVGTIAYMSPEQADPTGVDIDTRTDVYSLGVTLYQLLTGRLPVDPRDSGIHLFLVRLAAQELVVQRPSASITSSSPASEVAEDGRIGSARWRRTMRTDVDWVVMKAIEPDRSRRYETAAALADDLQRILDSEPVIARPPDARYRLRAFVRRNRLGVVAAGGIGLALVAGSVAATVGLLRATRAEADARLEAATSREVTEFLVGLFKVSDPSESRGSTITAREVLDSGAARVMADLETQPLVQARLMQHIGTVYRNLGMFGAAAPMLQASVAIRERSTNQDTALATAQLQLGILYYQLRALADAERQMQSSYRLRARLLGPRHLDVATSANALGVLYWQTDRLEEAFAKLNEALDLRRHGLGDDHPDLGTVLSNLGLVRADQGRFEEAIEFQRRALLIAERALPPNHPQTTNALNNLGFSLARVRPEEAEPYLRRAIAGYETALGSDHPTLSKPLATLGDILGRAGRVGESLRLMSRALTIRRQAYGPEHFEVAEAMTSIADLHLAHGRLDSAAVLYAGARSIVRTRFGEDSSDVLAISAMGDIERGLGRLSQVHRRTAEAVQHYEKAVSFYFRALDLEASSYRANDGINATRPHYVQALRTLGRTVLADSVEARLTITGR